MLVMGAGWSRGFGATTTIRMLPLRAREGGRRRCAVAPRPRSSGRTLPSACQRGCAHGSGTRRSRQNELHRGLHTHPNASWSRLPRPEAALTGRSRTGCTGLWRRPRMQRQHDPGDPARFGRRRCSGRPVAPRQRAPPRKPDQDRWRTPRECDARQGAPARRRCFAGPPVVRKPDRPKTTPRQPPEYGAAHHRPPGATIQHERWWNRRYLAPGHSIFVRWRGARKWCTYACQQQRRMAHHLTAGSAPALTVNTPNDWSAA